MPDSHSTAPGPAVVLTLPGRHREFLRRALDACCDGVFGDLAMAGQLRDPQRAWREAGAYERLLTAIDTGSIIPDPDVRRVVAALADSIDDGNEYARVVAEHAALVGLLDQIGGRR